MTPFGTPLKGAACALALLSCASAQAALVNHGDTFTDTDTGYVWRTLAQYDGLDFSTAASLLPAGFHVASAAELAALTAHAPAGAATFNDLFAAMGAKSDASMIWAFYGDGTHFLWDDGFATQWGTNAAANPYGWDNWGYDLPPAYSSAGLSLFAVDTTPVPEPASLALAGLGLAALVRRRR